MLYTDTATYTIYFSLIFHEPSLFLLFLFAFILFLNWSRAQVYTCCNKECICCTGHSLVLNIFRDLSLNVTKDFISLTWPSPWPIHSSLTTIFNSPMQLILTTCCPIPRHRLQPHFAHIYPHHSSSLSFLIPQHYIRPHLLPYPQLNPHPFSLSLNI